MTTRRRLEIIAREIFADWKNMSLHAKPYVSAMFLMNDITENYGLDSGRDIVVYFLVNAASWRGETAKRIKAELKAQLAETK